MYCKYVKREIRALTAEDRTAFFDAAQTLWKTTTEAGQRLYGPDYMDIMYFTSYHLTYAAERSCDHMHDGVGFMTQVHNFDNEWKRDQHERLRGIEQECEQPTGMGQDASTSLPLTLMCVWRDVCASSCSTRR